MKVSVSGLPVLLLACALLLLPLTPSAAAHQVPSETSSGGHGVLFIENAGQWDAGARYQAWGGSAGTLWLAEDALWLTLVERPAGEGADDADDEAGLQPRFAASRAGAASEAVTGTVANVRLSFPGANPHPRLEPYARVDTTVSYFLGSDPAGWRTAVPVWAGVRYVDLYPGIDLEIGGDGGQVTPRLVARPGADLGRVSLRVEGAEAVSVEGGRLEVSTAAGDLAFPLLAVDGAAIEPAARGVAAGGVFDVAAPFAAAAAGQGVQVASSITTTLLYSTFLGGNTDEEDVDLVVDAAGRAYVVGNTYSSDFPTTPGAFDLRFDYDGNYYHCDVFVARLNAAGSALEYATFLGGIGSDYNGSIAVDVAGRAYVVGDTDSSNFPTTRGAFDTGYVGEYGDVFVVCLDETGSSLVYGTFLGGSEMEGGMDIVVDAAGRAYLTGSTNSSDFPTTPGAFDTSLNSVYPRGDIFIARLNPTGSVLEYATFVGGSEDDWGTAIALDAAGRVYVTAATKSDDMPTTPGAFDTSINSTIDADAYVARLDATGSSLEYATYLGGSRRESLSGIAVDATGRAYLAGTTASADFPTTPGAFDTSLNSSGDNSDAVVVRLNPSGSALEYATFLGGSGSTAANGIAIDATGRAYVGGGTSAPDFPLTPDAFDTGFKGGSEVYLVRLDAAGSALEYGTLLSGSGSDGTGNIVLGAAGWVYVAGTTKSEDFPTTPGAFDTGPNGRRDAYVAKLWPQVEVEHLYLPALLR